MFYFSFQEAYRTPNRYSALSFPLVSKGLITKASLFQSEKKYVHFHFCVNGRSIAVFTDDNFKIIVVQFNIYSFVVNKLPKIIPKFIEGESPQFRIERF